MKVLIVEDDENKGKHLSQFVVEGDENIDLHLARSLNSGLRYLRQQHPDLVLLDMTLPTYDTSPDEPGGKTHIFGGQDFLRQMDRFKINIPVVVITQFETFGNPPHVMGLAELDARLKAEHPSVYCGAIYYHASIHEWKEKLRQVMMEIRGKKRGTDGINS